MLFLGGVAYPSRKGTPQTPEWVCQKVCQFAHRQDGVPGSTHPTGCINPHYNSLVDYGPFDSRSDQLDAEISQAMESFNDKTL